MITDESDRDDMRRVKTIREEMSWAEKRKGEGRSKEKEEKRRQRNSTIENEMTKRWEKDHKRKEWRESG